MGTAAVKNMSKAQSRQLVGWLLALPWPLDEETVLALADSLDWAVESREWGIGWATGYGLHKDYASATTPRDLVSDIRVVLATAAEPSPEAAAVLRDIFVDYVELVTGLVGDTHERRAGSRASSRWLLPDGSALRLTLSPKSCMFHVTSPEFVGIETDLARR